jgi:hypothetical protein
MVSRLYIRRLETEVTEMRNRLEVGKANLPEQLPEFPRGCCGPVSWVLGAVLGNKYGHNVVYVLGKRDNVSYGHHQKEPQSHAWVEINDIIVDITSDQFPDRPSVYVNKDRIWYDKWVISEKEWAVRLEYFAHKPSCYMYRRIYEVMTGEKYNFT